MSDGTKIEWTDASWNPIRAFAGFADGSHKTGWHCEHVSEGCRNCYAERMNQRLGTGFAYKPGHLRRPGPFPNDSMRGNVSIFLDEKMLTQPLRWKKPRKIFVCSMTDLFGAFVTDEMIAAVFNVMAECPRHIFQVLTKRAERMQRLLYGPKNHHLWSQKLWHRSVLPNVWLGVSVEDREQMLARGSHLLATPAAVRWWSAEPLLGDLGTIPPALRPDWVVLGGESGRGARPMHPDWARSVRDQCAAAGVPFLFKQWGEWEASLDRERDDPDWRSDYSNFYAESNKSRWLNLAGGCGFHGERFHVMRRVGKKAAGRLLDGVQHDGYPT